MDADTERKTGILTSQQYAMRLLQMLQDFGEELIKVDTVILVVKMLTRHPVDYAVLYASGDAYKFGAIEFDSRESALEFLGQLSQSVAYAAFIDGQFHIYRYPYRSEVMGEWVFLRMPGRAPDAARDG